jgi:hypothetical protein
MAYRATQTDRPTDAYADRRRFTRIPFTARVRIEGPGGTWAVELLDLSLKGALAGRPEDWPADAAGRYRLCIELDRSEGPEISMDTTPVHVQRDRIGFRCERIDLTSASHLRRLVELNLGDPALLERELGALVGLD